LSLHKKCFSEYDIDCPQQKAGEDKTVNDGKNDIDLNVANEFEAKIHS